MKKLLRPFVATITLALLALAPHARAMPIVSVGSAAAANGEIFALEIAIADALDLVSFQFDLAFGPAILQVIGAGVGETAFFTGGDSTVFSGGFTDNVAGHILGVADALTFQSPLSGDGVLVTVPFKAIGTGITAVTLSSVFLNLADDGFVVTNGTVCVHPDGVDTCRTQDAPEPASLPLLALGLGLLAQRRGTRHRRHPAVRAGSAA